MDARGDRAVLLSWMGDKASHPLASLLTEPGAYGVQWLEAMETLVTTVERVQPERWAGKRRDFQDLAKVKDPDAAWEQFRRQRTELVVTAAVINAGIRCAFGKTGRSNPDLALPDLGLGLEITRRTPKTITHVQQDLRKALQDHPGVDVHLRFDPYPARLSAEVRERLLTEIVRAAEQLHEDQPTMTFRAIDRPRARRDMPELAIPEIRINVALQLEEGGGISWSGPGNPTALLTPSMDVVYDEVIAVVDDDAKVKQAGSMPCVLVCDVMDLGLAWMSDRASWANGLAVRLPEDYPFVAVAVTACDLLSPTSNYAIAIAPSATDHVRAAVTQLAERLAMTMPAVGTALQ